MILPPLPEGFPPPVPEIQFPRTPREASNVMNIGWDGLDGMMLSTEKTILISNLFQQGALFIRGDLIPKTRGKYLVGVRFALDNIGLLKSCITLAEETGTPTDAALILPDEPRIKESWGPMLARRIKIRLDTFADQFSLKYYSYELITSSHVSVLVFAYSINPSPFILDEDIDLRVGPAQLAQVSED